MLIRESEQQLRQAIVLGDMDTAEEIHPELYKRIPAFRWFSYAKQIMNIKAGRDRFSPIFN